MALPTRVSPEFVTPVVVNPTPTTQPQTTTSIPWVPIVMVGGVGLLAWWFIRSRRK